jgi:hypothetical protein
MTMKGMLGTAEDRRKEAKQRIRGGCGKKRCKTCPYMKGSTGHFRSMVTGRDYRVGGEAMLDCGSKNIVYLTSCARCGVQYTGKTVQELRKRQNLNRSQGTGYKEMHGIIHLSCRRLIEHFYGGKGCNEEHIRVQPIEQIIIEEEVKDKDEERDRRLAKAENKWIKELRTVYPYGLNDKTEGEQKGMGKRSVEIQFTKGKRRKRKRGKGKNKKMEDMKAEEVFESMLKEGTNPEWQNRLRIAVNQLEKTEIGRLMIILEHAKRTETDCKVMVLHCVMDMLKTRGTQELKEMPIKEKPRVIWKMKYLSEGTSMLRLGRMMRETEAVNAVPAEAETKVPVVVYEHTDTVRKTLLNHKRALRELTERDWEGRQEEPCGCENYHDRRHPVLNHVITGDFEGIVKIESLKELMWKGLGHREPVAVDWEKVEKEAIEGLEGMINGWAKKEGVMEQGWKEWGIIMEKNIRNRVRKMRGKETQVEEILTRREVKEELKRLHTHFVLCPVDKAGNNILIVCKRFYQRCLITEFSSADSGKIETEKRQASIPKNHNDGSENTTEEKDREETQEQKEKREEMEERKIEEMRMQEECNEQEQDWDKLLEERDEVEMIDERIAMETNEQEEEDKEAQSTYTRVDETEDEIVNRVKEKLRKYGIEVEEKQEKLAEMYMTGKMHKTVPKMRFIAASRNCVTKTLSAILTKVLKQCYKQHKHLNTLKTNKTGMNHLWITDSKEEVLQRIGELNEEREGRNVDTYDFETLYTNIPHKKLKEHICRIIQEAYDSQAKNDTPRLYISTGGWDGKWIVKPSKGTHAIDCKTAQELVRLLINNIYVKVGGRNFKQTMGIPMGTDCAPFLANLYLFALESSWVDNKRKQGQYDVLQYFKHCFRYIDDLDF